jgi:hypothetical protein
MPLALYPLTQPHLTLNVAKTNLQINAKGHKSKGNIISSRGCSWETLPFAKFAHYLSECLFVDVFFDFRVFGLSFRKNHGFSIFVFVFCRFSFNFGYSLFCRFSSMLFVFLGFLILANSLLFRVLSVFD